DDFKELLGEIYLPETVEDSQKLGSAVFDLLDFLAESQLKAGKDCLIEANFNRKFAKPQFERLAQQYSATIVEIYCWCDHEVRKQRFLNRSTSGERHKVHLDDHRYIADSSIQPDPLSINEHVFMLDTTNGYEKGLKELFVWLQKFKDLPKQA